jgi:DNA-binding transcriptional ArsR family regulator
VLLVVADRVTEGARRVLTGHRAGYYDLRGHLALRSDSVVIDADVQPVSGRAERVHPLSGKAGLEVATALLMEPAAGVAVRELARRLGRSPSTVSEVLAALRRAGLVDDQHRVEGTELFWQVADSWPATRVYLARLPVPGDDATITKPLRLGLDDAETTAGWALADSAAAVVYGAPLAVRTRQICAMSPHGWACPRCTFPASRHGPWPGSGTGSWAWQARPRSRDRLTWPAGHPRDWAGGEPAGG